MKFKDNFKDLVTYNEPTNIVIIGCDNMDEMGVQFGITDDETVFDIKFDNGKKSKSISSFGFCTVISLKDYIKYYKKNSHDMGQWGIVEGIVVPNYKGTIGIAAFNEEENIYVKDIDLTDYINHQGDDYSAILNIDSDKYFDLNEDLSVPIALLRDFNIDTIIS